MVRSEGHLVAHLLRRAGFGVGAEELATYTALGFEGAVDKLINFEQVDDSDLEKNLLAMREANPISTHPEFPEWGNREVEVAVWLARMLSTKRPLQEKMSLFWHGHFCSSVPGVHSSNLICRQNELFRNNALTPNVKELTKLVARDPAMLVYLDNRTNMKGRPNENWARELIELFTLGIGSYSENDVKEAARAFTGWQLSSLRLSKDVQFFFNSKQHDEGQKTFLGVSGNLNGDDIIEIIFKQPAHPKFIVRKLFRFFVYDNPEEATITRFADIYTKSGFNIKELVRQLLLSSEFRSDRAYKTLIKSPLEYVIGVLRTLSARVYDVQVWKTFNWALEAMGQVVYDPPNVAGWAGGTTWINSSTYLSRANFAKTAVNIASGMTIDPGETAITRRLLIPDAAIDYFADLLVQDSATPYYKKTLHQMIYAQPGAQPYKAKMRMLVHTIMSSPAYQMN